MAHVPALEVSPTFTGGGGGFGSTRSELSDAVGESENPDRSGEAIGVQRDHRSQSDLLGTRAIDGFDSNSGNDEILR